MAGLRDSRGARAALVGVGFDEPPAPRPSAYRMSDVGGVDGYVARNAFGVKTSAFEPVLAGADLADTVRCGAARAPRQARRAAQPCHPPPRMFRSRAARASANPPRRRTCTATTRPTRTFTSQSKAARPRRT